MLRQRLLQVKMQRVVDDFLLDAVRSGTSCTTTTTTFPEVVMAFPGLPHPMAFLGLCARVNLSPRVMTSLSESLPSAPPLCCS